ncbi:alpha/beta fold hydrolase [Microlunatus ginsengisoli]|uniref:AB hydrolase-1 domain-containing protein n=1 Tax=Microlunatus ginsengisoli TaxID=363863 RepID=A0ABP6ZP25_9ACTN
MSPTPLTATALLAGCAAAVTLVVAPILPPDRHILTGAVLIGLASGWALLVMLLARSTGRPQRWAAAPAAFLLMSGIVSMTGSAAVQAVFGWVWPAALLVLVGWMVPQIRRQVPSRGTRWLLYPVVAALALAAAGAGHEAILEARDVRADLAPGRLVDVGGHRLHLHCTGSGSPAVVLEPGLGGSSADLRWIAPVVARDTTVCVYDRAGRGWSDPPDGPQDADQIAADLHTLLAAAGVAGPFVLAGHSFGGLYVLDFAARFPEQVAGLVLLDSTAPRSGLTRPATAEPPTAIHRIAAVAPALAQLGAGSQLASTLREFVAGSASTRQASALTDFGDKPLLVLTAGTGHDATWRSAQDRLATLSTHAVHRVAPGATHESLVDDRVDSAAASQAVRDVVAAVRDHRSSLR